MIESNIILVDAIPEYIYRSLIEDCVKYAIISSPFTVDRMDIPDVKKRVTNIAKGKIAESIFKFFCINNNIDIDFDSCSTPFWTVDKRDFLLLNSEWDIKNNFIYHSGRYYSGLYTDLPALIPNRFSGDQWSKRNELLHNSNKSSYLFTFLCAAPLINGNRGEEFLEIILSNGQTDFLNKLYEKYLGLPQEQQPFTENEFWNKFYSLGDSNTFLLRFQPVLVIGGYADNATWGVFRDTGPYERNNFYQNYKKPFWYKKYGSLNFLNGTLWTKITNATAAVSMLPSFASLFPHLEQTLNYAHFKR